jgi:hypothetical protein
MAITVVPTPLIQGPTGPTGPTGATGASLQVAVFTYKLAANTDGGDATSGSFLTRPLNTSQFNTITGASLSSNQITLPSGSYWCEGFGAFYSTVGRVRQKLRNITDSSDTLLGINQDQTDGAGNGIINVIQGAFTITAQKTFELQYRVQNTVSGNGLGDSTFGFGIDEVYASITFQKL